jgi:hypothetical protein
MTVIKRVGLLAALLGVMIAGCSPARQESAAKPTASGACPVTIANGSTPPDGTTGPNLHGNGQLWTGLRPEGKVLARANPGGSIGMKWMWWRGAGVRGELKIAGRRLDAPAPPLRAEIPLGYGLTGFQASGLIFPTPGCWEVTGKAGEASLTFVTLVVKTN